MGAETCCGRARQVVVLGDGAATGAGTAAGAALLRCTVCARGEWRLDGRAVDRAEALAALGTAYREAPRLARAARDRAATTRAARAAARTAAAAGAGAPAAGQSLAQAAVPEQDRREELGRLLQGWGVLGATG